MLDAVNVSAVRSVREGLGGRDMTSRRASAAAG
jgi:hypothetical protein